MENLKLYKKQISEVKNLIEKLEKGELSLSELSNLESTTRSLHERSIILKYKAYEEGTSNVSVPNMDSSVTHVEDNTSSDSAKVEDMATPDSPFDWNPLSEEEDVIEEDTTAIELTEEEIAIETPPSIQEIMGDLSEQKETIQEIIEENMVPTQDNDSENSASFVDQLNLSDQSKHSLSIGTKIDSLIGAFGLNEKLRFINDLFDGSSESFNEAIKILDVQNDMAEANSKINDLASTHSWEVEEETVTEFVAFVNRRYA